MDEAEYIQTFFIQRSKNTSIHQLMNLHKGRIWHSNQQDEFYCSKQTLIFICCAFPHLFVYVSISYKHKDISVYGEMQAFLRKHISATE